MTTKIRGTINRVEKLQKQYGYSNRAYIAARNGIEKALAMLGNTSNPNHIKKMALVLESTLKEIKTLRDEY